MPAMCRIEATGLEETFESGALRQPAANQRSQQGANVYTHIKERKPAVPARIARCVEASDHRADIGFKKSRSAGNEGQARIKESERMNRHRKVAACNDHSTDEYRARCA